MRKSLPLFAAVNAPFSPLIALWLDQRRFIQHRLVVNNGVLAAAGGSSLSPLSIAHDFKNLLPHWVANLLKQPISAFIFDLIHRRRRSAFQQCRTKLPIFVRKLLC